MSNIVIVDYITAKLQLATDMVGEFELYSMIKKQKTIHSYYTEIC